LVARGSDLRQTQWALTLDRAGDLYWRVIAVSASGLEGYPSRAVSFRVASTTVDRGGPVSVVIPVGFYRRLDDGRMLIGGKTRLKLAAHDDAVAVSRIEYRWGEAPWQDWDGNELGLSEQVLPAILMVRATDILGKLGVPVQVRIDADQ